MKQENTLNVSVDIETLATNHINNSLQLIRLSLTTSVFFPTDTLEHLKNCGKYASRKSEHTFVQFASSKGLRFECSHLCTMSKKFTCKMSDTGLKVNKGHMYFYQVQQRLFVVNRLWGVLVSAILGSNG